jgi:aminoglycoside phosphotransferase (APT) family kinase protein
MEKRKLSYNEALLGRGRVAEVFTWGDDLALKLFYEGRSLKSLEQEARICRLVHEAGLATPAVGDVVEVNGRHGIVCERLSGPSMLAEMSAKPWKLGRSAQTLAELHASMHHQLISDLPRQRQALRESIASVSALGDPKKDTVLQLLDELPDGKVLCHGDFHPENVVMTERGAIVIDWTTATKGNPLADVARTSLVLQLGKLPPGIPAMTRLLVRLGRSLFHKLYLGRYFRLRPEHQQQLAAWQLPIAVARMGDGIEEEQSQLRSMIDAWLAT